MLDERLDSPCKGDIKLAAKQGRPVRTNLEVLCDLAIKAAQKMAMEGDLRPFQVVLETAYGKAPKEILHGGTVEHQHTHDAGQLMEDMRGQLLRLREAPKEPAAAVAGE